MDAKKTFMQAYKVLSNATQAAGFSPVSLDQSFSRIQRLLFIIALIAIGVLANSFFIASFFTNIQYSKKAYVFLACVGFADFMISSSILSIIGVVLLSNEWDNMPVCYTIHIIALASTYYFSMCMTMTALETFLKVYSPKHHEKLIRLNFFVLVPLTLIISYGLAVIGVLNDADYDYCSRKFTGNYNFRLTTNVIFHAIPVTFTFSSFFLACVRYKNRAKKLKYKRSLEFHVDSVMCRNNMICFILYVGCWLPHVVIVLGFPDASDRAYYYTAWIPMFRSTFTGVIYLCLDPLLTSSYSELFVYVCCKDTLHTPFVRRHKRQRTPRIQVHILNQAITNAQREHRAALASGSGYPGYARQV